LRVVRDSREGAAHCVREAGLFRRDDILKIEPWVAARKPSTKPSSSAA
jgi:hypothetical protein